MATDYFTMMRDVVGSYGEGLDLARARRKSDAEETRKETLFNQEQEQYQRKLGLQRQADAAYADQNTLATVGNVNYGGETGARGLQSAEGDYQREANRMGLSRADMPTGAGAVVATKATDRDFNNAALRVAIAKQDDTGIAAARDKDRVLRMRDVYDNVAKIKDPDLETHAAGVNLNGDVPLIYTSKDAKGYTFMTTKPDGTPIPGSTFRATPAQVRQMVLAKALADEGFGPESMDIASKAHDALNKHITGLNSQTLEVTKGNNTAQKDEVAGTAATIHAGAAATSAGTHAKLAGLQMDEIKNAQKRREDAGAIVAEYNGLTDAEKTGDKGRALVTKFNILNAKNGGQVSFQTPKGSGKTPMDVPVDIKQNGDGGFVAFEKDGGNPLYNIGPNGDKRPLGMSAADHAKLMKDASAAGTPVVEGYDGTGKFTLRVQGRDGKYYSSVQEAATAKPAKALPAAGAASSPSGPAYDWNAPLVPGGVSPPRFGIPQPKGMRTLDDRL